MRTPIRDAIDGAIFWAGICLGVVFMLATLGALTFFMGRTFVSGLPIVWDGSGDMWEQLYIGHWVILGIVGIIWLVGVCIASWRTRREDQRSKEERSADRAHGAVYVVLFAVLGLGLNGLFPTSSGDVSYKMPLWVAIVLTLLGGVGMWFHRRPRTDQEPRERQRKPRPPRAGRRQPRTVQKPV